MSLFWQRSLSLAFLSAIVGFLASGVFALLGNLYVTMFYTSTLGVMMLGVLVAKFLKCQCCGANYSVVETLSYGRCRNCVMQFPDDDAEDNDE